MQTQTETFNACLMRSPEKWIYGTVAENGTVLERVNCTQSGDYSPPETSFHKLMEGAHFLDKRPLSHEALVHLVYSGPMLSLSLAPGQDDRFTSTQRATLAEMTPALSGGFEAIARAVINPEWRGLDFIALPEYCRLYMDAGARVGIRRGNFMEWNDGTRTEIPPCECWKDVCRSCNKLRHYVDRIPGSYIPQARKPSGPDDHCPECRGKA